MRNLTNTEATDLTGLHVQLVDPATGEQHKSFPADSLSVKPLYAGGIASAADGTVEGQFLYVTDTGDEFGQITEVYTWIGGIWSPYPQPLQLWSNATGTLTNVFPTEPVLVQSGDPASGTQTSLSLDPATGTASLYGSDKVVLNSGGEYEFVNVPEDVDTSAPSVLVYDPTTYKVEHRSLSSIVGAPVTVSDVGPPTDPSTEGAIHLVTDDGLPTGTVLEQYIYDTDSGTWIEMNRNAKSMLKFGTTAPTSSGDWDGEEYFVTSDGTSTGTVLAQYVYDYQTSTWVLRPQPQITTTSLTPVVYNGSAYVNAQANSDTMLADLIKLSDGTYIHDGKVTWTGHGLTVGSWYYLSQTAAGAVVTPAPTTGWMQQLFFVEDANTIHVDIEEGVEAINSSGTGVASFSKTVYVNAVSPTAATIFDLNNPPATNDNTLKADSRNIYIGTDGSTWTYNSATSTYTTYTYPTTVPHGVYAQRAAGFSVATGGAGTTISGYTTGSNTAGTAWNPTAGTFTVEREGWYDISASLMWAAGNWNANGQYSLSITVNGAGVSTAYWVQHVAVTSNFVSTLQTSTKYYLKAGDVVRVYTWQSSGSAKTTYAASYNTFSIVQVA